MLLSTACIICFTSWTVMWCNCLALSALFKLWVVYNFFFSYNCCIGEHESFTMMWEFFTILRSFFLPPQSWSLPHSLPWPPLVWEERWGYPRWYPPLLRLLLELPLVLTAVAVEATFRKAHSLRARYSVAALMPITPFHTCHRPRWMYGNLHFEKSYIHLDLFICLSVLGFMLLWPMFKDLFRLPIKCWKR